MAFDFDDNVEVQSAFDYTQEQIDAKTAPIIEKHLDSLNRGYFNMIHSRPESHTSYNGYNPSYDDAREHPFEFTVPTHMTSDKKILRFYTRDIRNTGYGAWKTLNFWINHVDNLFTGEIWFDKAALTNIELFITSSGINSTNDYYGFKKMSTGGLKVYFKPIMKFMDFIHMIKSTYRQDEIDPNLTATTLATSNIFSFCNKPAEIIEFLKYCRHYEDNPCMYVKVTSSFMMSLVYTLDDKMEWDSNLYNEIITALSDMLEKLESVTMKVSLFADTVLSLMEKYNIDLDTLKTSKHNNVPIKEQEITKINNYIFKLSRC